MPGIVLYQPLMPANSGNIIRLSVNAGMDLHMIKPFGFDMEEKKLRRAGLDYHEFANIKQYENFEEYYEENKHRNIYICETCSSECYTEKKYDEDCHVIFGSEKYGISDDVINVFPMNMRIRIPMKPNTRSLNLSNTVAIVTYEIQKQLGFPGMQ